MIDPPGRDQSEHSVWASRRLWSLWDMIDFHLRPFMDALAELNIAQTRARMVDPDTFPEFEALEPIRANLAAIDREAANLAMATVRGRLARIAMLFSPGAVTTYGTLAHEIDELFNAVERDARDEFFCHYQKERIGWLQRMPMEWESVFKAFKSARPEIEAGIDCFALGHNAACVFHMCRVGEIGLRAIARERGIKNVRKDVPLEWGTWGQVFAAIEAALKAIRQKPTGPKKDVALTFYDTILSDLHAIQSLYRDRTMHFRKSYDDGEAQTAMLRARELMKTLASKLTEDSTRALPWSAWK
jgi:hypothetical protein